MKKLAKEILKDLEQFSFDNMDDFDKYDFFRNTLENKVKKLCNEVIEKNNALECSIEDKLRCTMIGYNCNVCRRNPDAELKDCFVDRGYIPTCKYGHDDCVCDPAYLKNGSNCDGCFNGDWYDDEDK